MTYESEVLADSPYFYWRLGDSSGTVATDSSGNARDGTYTNGPTLGAASLIASDLTNTAAEFDGVNDYINSTVTNDPASFTAECWMKSDTAVGAGAFLMHRWPSSSGSRVWYIIVGTTNIQFGVKNAASVELTATYTADLNDDVAHHIVGTYDGTNIRLYVDGVLADTEPLSGPLNATGTPFQAAAQAGTNGQYVGVLDEIAYYTTALSDARILAHFDAAAVPPPEPPTITTTSLPDGTVGVLYDACVESDPEGLSWGVGGDFAPGLTLDYDLPCLGIVGTPTTAGTYCTEYTAYDPETDLYSDPVELCITIHDAPPPTPTDVGGCDWAQDWRLELVDLATGQRRGWLPFLSFSFDDLLDQVGVATVTVPVRKVKMRDIWPHLRAVVFTRTSGPDASESSPVCEYIGMIETVRAESGGTVQLGLQSIEHYLTYRTLTGDTSYTSMDQNQICAELVAEGSGSGIPLTGEFETSAYTRTRSWTAEDDAIILEQILEITKAIRGPDYQRVFTFAAGAWSTTLRFSDYVGNTTPSKLNAVRGLISYGISVEAGEHANWVRGRDQAGNVYTDETYMDDIYPRFNRAVQWSDVTLNDTLVENVEGYLANHSDPIAVPDATVADLNISTRFKIGDSIDLDMDHGAIRYKGVARLVGKSWSIAPETPTLCTFSFVPLENAHATILGAPPGNGAGCC